MAKNNSIVKPPLLSFDNGFSMIALGATAWYLLGLSVLIYAFTISETEILLLYSAEQVQYLDETPIWILISQILIVLSGFIGSACLLWKRRRAYIWYTFSMINIVLFLLDILLRNGVSIMNSSYHGALLMITLAGVLLVWVGFEAKQDELYKELSATKTN